MFDVVGMDWRMNGLDGMEINVIKVEEMDLKHSMEVMERSLG